MVAGSRSSLRRPTLRGDQHQSGSDSPVIEDRFHHTQPNDILRAKRIRPSTYSDREQEQKRRKLINRNHTSQLRIPLRGRTSVLPVVSPKIVTQPVVISESSPLVSQTSKPIDSPTYKPQYDQIRLIEEKARASIRGIGGVLQSNAQEDRRKLRSEHGGSRAKTELSQYFPNFDEMLSLELPDPETLTANSKIVLVDDTPDYRPPIPRSEPFGSQRVVFKTEVLSLTKSSKSRLSKLDDPMNDEFYGKIHRKAERHEKQMKNGDRERAQHEKYQLERLLEDLRGPDWLKTLGVSGVTDTEKKRYEPKRTLFIRETKALIEKFKWWKEEEKRRKLEREQALMEEAEDEDEDDDEDDDEEEESGEDEDEDDGEDVEEGSVTDIGSASNGLQSVSSQAPDSSEIDALASQQLLQEAKFANTKRKKPVHAEEVMIPLPIHKPFVSFFAKRHLRDTAVSGRQRGRTLLAFGHSIPDLDERDFELPENILTGDAIRASQRSRRRLRRGVDD